MDHSMLQLHPPGDSEFFYSHSSREQQCIGHLRGYFDSSGMFISNWWPHEAHALNTPEFKSEFQGIMDTLRKGILANMREMRVYIDQHPHPLDDLGYNSPHGYLFQSAAHDYFIRCTPQPGDYNVYIYAYVR